jgi:uncharacterized cofD-like protein
VQGEVLPSTLHDVKLLGDLLIPQFQNEYRVEGERSITESPGAIKHVWLEPSNAPAFPKAIQAILAADIIVVGPGSLYTSLLPNLLVPDLADAIRSSRALRLYICNVSTQPGETDGYSVGDHLRAFEEHAGGGLFDIYICNNRYEGSLPANIDWVRLEDDLEQDYKVYKASLFDPLHPWRHDSQKIGQVIQDLYEERTGPLVE